MLRKSLLVCGVLASLVYVGTDVLAAIQYGEYHSFTSRVISELMASGSPTERLVDPFLLFYGVLSLAFGVGVWMSSTRKNVHVVAGLLIAATLLGFLGPTLFEMNVRGSGGDPAADVRHIALTSVMGMCYVAAVAVGAFIHGRSFRLYSFATLLVMVVFAVLTSFASRGMGTGAPTPWVGLLERIDIGAYLLWVAVLAFSFLRADETEAGAPTSHRLPAWPAAHRP
jgi:hypothetical protein